MKMKEKEKLEMTFRGRLSREVKKRDITNSSEYRFHPFRRTTRENANEIFYFFVSTLSNLFGCEN